MVAVCGYGQVLLGVYLLFCVAEILACSKVSRLDRVLLISVSTIGVLFVHAGLTFIR